MTEPVELDRYSLAILAELLRDSSQTLQQVADRVGLSASPCWKRIKAMEAAGVIRGYTAVIDPEKVGLGLRVIVEAHLGQHSEHNVRQFEKTVAASAPIVHCYSTTGESDYLMDVLMPDIKQYEQFLHETLFRLPGVTKLRSSIVLKELKSEMRLPEAETAAPPKRRRAGAR